MMKRFLLVLAMVVILMSFPIQSIGENVKFGPTAFEVCYDKTDSFLDIQGKNIHLRVYESGKITKEIWSEINPNEGGSLLVASSALSTSYYYTSTVTVAWDTVTKNNDDTKNKVTKAIWKEFGKTFRVSWNQDKKYLEVNGSKVKLRIHECGRVEQHLWKDISGQK